MRFFIIEKKEIYNKLNDRSKLLNKIAINARINTKLPQLKKLCCIIDADYLIQS